MTLWEARPRGDYVQDERYAAGAGRAELHHPEPSRAGQDQHLGRQRLRRGRLCGRPAVDHERHRRCAGRQAHRHAGHAGEGVAGDQRGLVRCLFLHLPRLTGEGREGESNAKILVIICFALLR